MFQFLLAKIKTAFDAKVVYRDVKFQFLLVKIKTIACVDGVFVGIEVFQFLVVKIKTF